MLATLKVNNILLKEWVVIETLCLNYSIFSKFIYTLDMKDFDSVCLCVTLIRFYAQLDRWRLILLQIHPLFYRFFLVRCSGFYDNTTSICGGGHDLGLWFNLGFCLFWVVWVWIWAMLDFDD